MAGFPVKVYIYDLTKGMARTMSQALIGKQLDGVWHTGIVVYDQEFFYGGEGIQSCAPGHTILGQPEQIEHLGTTEVPSEMFFEYMQDLASSTFRPDCYHLLNHNCNTFSDEVANFLTGKSIPSHITNLPQEVMATPFGAMIRPFIDSMTVSPGAGGGAGNTFSPTGPAPSLMGSQGQQSQPGQAAAAVNNDSSSHTVKFEEKEVLSQYASIKSSLSPSIDESDVNVLNEIHEFLSTKDCSWGLGKLHVKTLTKLLLSPALSEEAARIVGGLLQKCLLHEDVMGLVRNDKDRDYLVLLAKYEESENITVKKAMVRSMCNVSSCKAGRDWLLSSEGPPITDSFASNQKLTLSVCSSCVLSEDPKLNNLGTALCYNVTKQKICPETAMDMGIALTQLATKDLQKSIALHLLISLEVCMSTNPEVTELAKVMGLEIAKYSPMSDTHRKICQQIQQKLK